ncbi:uncharacterized protein LOC129301225 [Prosopis cineraria]|uniref:uncharacterized protein LOC129301225 n=1 Tax=Prosopis cineraria TaxID=364024 RepID=UPI00240F76F3|nr:uncharacterized protein LOC129301225 [Prosopis cineraria]
MGAMLGQLDDSGKKERAIYFLSKKFNECEARYPVIERTCCGLVWATRRLRQYMLYYTTWLISRVDPLKYIFESPHIAGRVLKWQVVLSEYDIKHVMQKSVKGSAIADHLADNPLGDDQPLDFQFPDEGICTTEEGCDEGNNEEQEWEMYFDGAANMHGNGVGAVIVSPEGKQFPVFGDSALIIHQVTGEWRTKDVKLIPYQELLTDLIKQFKVASFHHLTRDKNRFADALATLAAMIQLDCGVHIQPIQVEARSFPAYCLNVEEDREEYPWFQDIKDYITKRSYPAGMTENEKKTLRRLAMTFFISQDVLYKRGYDGTLLRCVSSEEANKIMDMRAYVARMRMVTLWPNRFKASNGHRFILVAIDYFTKWVEANSFASITQKTFLKFMKTNILCRYGIPERIITDNGPNLNGTEVRNFCEKFQIKHHNSAPYRPQMNGAVEAANKNIKKIIGKMTVTYKDWHEMLPYALHGYRTTASTSIGVTPYSLVYGMEAVTPIEIEIPSLRVLAEVDLEENEWIRTRFEQLNMIEEKRLIAMCHGQLYQKRMARAFDKKLRPREFSAGDLVLKKILPNQEDNRGKWAPTYEGPYVVKHAFSGGALILADMDGQELAKPINADAVKRYFA